MTPTENNDMHLLLQLLRTLDVGLVMVDRDHRIRLWNSFMESHSGIHTGDAVGTNLFSLFPELPEDWLKARIDAAFSLQSRSHSIWQLHRRLFDFKSSRPLTGRSQMMYQNVSMIPITDVDKTVSRVGLIIYDVTEMATSKMALETANRSLETLSRTDPLTALFNRGYWEECLLTEFRRCQRGRTRSSLLLLDIDHFKPVNDTLGHQAGDEVIREVADLLKQTARATDTAGRYGGEEFALILPDTTKEDALQMAERLRKLIAGHPMDCGSETIRITVSLGVCEFNDTLTDYRQWIECTDRALYRAKEGGRNRSCASLDDNCDDIAG
ncbi:MAG: diguanylate cyclase [Pseudohongiellaceae bacterium]